MSAQALTAEACPEGRVPEDGFDDAAGVHESSVDCVVWWSVAKGRSSDSYAGGLPVTRAQMASFVVRLMTAGAGDLAESPPDAFGDDDGSVHASSIDRLADAGVVVGTGDGYAPAAHVSRAQMATYLVRAYEDAVGTELAPGEDSFSDDEGSVHETNINKAAAAGFTTGLTDTTYGPGFDVTRAQMGSFLARVLNRFVTDGRAHLPPSTFDDGTYRLPAELPAGLYRALNPSSACYWERLSGFSGDLADVIANHFGGAVTIVEVGAGDAGFSSDGCGIWSSSLIPRTDGGTASLGSGDYLVNEEVAAGTWRSGQPDGLCYWERLSGFSGELADVIANGTSNDAPVVVDIVDSDAGFSSSGCNGWTRVE